MSVTFYTVDVGHGLCQVILFDRRAILIDGGGAVGKKVAEDFLTRYVDTIVAYVATHNDSDHVQAAPELLDAFPTQEKLHYVYLLLDRPAKKKDQSDEEVIPLLGYARKRQHNGTIKGMYLLYLDDAPGKVKAKVLHHERAEEMQLQLLYPKLKDTTAAILSGTPDPKATNEASAILRLIVGGRKNRAAVLITGDASCRSFASAREEYLFDIGARVLSMPHHGGNIPAPAECPSWEKVVHWISPEIAVVSAGFGTVPGPTTTQRGAFAPLRSIGAKICCTEITMHCHSNFLSLHPGVLSKTPVFPQLSGRVPQAVACGGTIAVKIDTAGEVDLFHHEEHQRQLTAKIAGATPHCR